MATKIFYLFVCDFYPDIIHIENLALLRPIINAIAPVVIVLLIAVTHQSSWDREEDCLQPSLQLASKNKILVKVLCEIVEHLPWYHYRLDCV